MSFFQKYEINPNGVICVLLSCLACYVIYKFFDGFLIKPKVIIYTYLYIATTFTIFLIFLYRTAGCKESYISYTFALFCICMAVIANALAGYYYANLFQFTARNDLVWLIISSFIIIQYIIFTLLFSLNWRYNIIISLLFVMVLVLMAEPVLIKALGMALASISFIFFCLGCIVLLSIVFKSRG